MLALTIILFIICISLSIALYYTYKAAKIQYDKVKVYEQWIIDIKNNVYDTYAELKSIDNKQIFEKDDDVGIVFQQLHDTLLDLQTKVSDE